MGYPKALLSMEGQPFVAHLARRMLAAVPSLIVVVGAYAEAVRAAVPADRRIRVVVNPDYRAGQLSSLKCALAAIDPESVGIMLHLTDHPLVAARTFERISEEFAVLARPIAIARYAGKRGHPVVFGRSLFAELLAAPMEAGARVVVDRDPARVAYVDVLDPGVIADLDTPADLAQAGLQPPPLKD
jgi:molybdenum cofactor cytidylyltransferase